MVNYLYAHFNKSPTVDEFYSPEFVLERLIREHFGVAKPFFLEKSNIHGGNPIVRTEVSWDELRKAYNKGEDAKNFGVYIKPGTSLEWREHLVTHPDLIEALKSYNSSGCGVLHLNPQKIDSFTVQAIRRDLIEPGCFLQSVLWCISRTDDGNNLILGARGEGEGNTVNQIIAVPGGAIGYPSLGGSDLSGRLADDECNLTQNVIREAIEELPITASKIKKLDLIGIYGQHGKGPYIPNSNVFLYVMDICDSAEDIIRKHAEAIKRYKSFKLKARENITDPIEQESYARSEMVRCARENRGFPADAWENGCIIKFRNDPDYLIKEVSRILNSGRIFKHGLYGALAIYFKHEFDDNYYKRLMKIPQFIEQTRKNFIVNN